MDKNRKAILLPLTLIISFFLAVLISVSLLRSRQQIQVVEQKIDSSRAFSAAETGIEEAVNKLRNDKDWNAGLPEPYAPGQVSFLNDPVSGEVVGEYWLDPDKDIIRPGPAVGAFKDTVWIQAWGRAPDPDRNGQFMIRRLAALIALETPASYLTATQGELVVSANATLNGSILARDLEFAGAGTTVNGDVLYINKFKEDPVNPPLITGAKTLSTGLTFARVDLAKYRDLAEFGGKYKNGNLHISGSIDKANLNSPNGLVFAEGDVYIKGTVKDDVTIVAGGNVYIEGDILCQGSGSSEKQIAVIAKEDVKIKNYAPTDLTIEALIMADGGVLEAEAGISSRKRLRIKGAMTVRGSQDGTTAVKLAAYKQRTYDYNSELYDNCRLPFLPNFMAILRWKEMPPDAVNFPLLKNDLGYINPLR